MIAHRLARNPPMRLVALIAPLALLAACATDTASSAGAPTEPASANGREEKIVCGMEAPTGSRLRVRRCWTQEQLDQEGRDAKAAIERGQLSRPNPQR
jgi:hypothetical protein